MIETLNHNTRLQDTNKSLNLKQIELKNQIQSAQPLKRVVMRLLVGFHNRSLPQCSPGATATPKIKK